MLFKEWFSYRQQQQQKKHCRHANFSPLSSNSTFYFVLVCNLIKSYFDTNICTISRSVAILNPINPWTKTQKAHFLFAILFGLLERFSFLCSCCQRVCSNTAFQLHSGVSQKYCKRWEQKVRLSNQLQRRKKFQIQDGKVSLAHARSSIFMVANVVVVAVFIWKHRINEGAHLPSAQCELDMRTRSERHYRMERTERE